MQSAQKELSALYKNISRVVIGKKDTILLTLATLLCRGHLLIEDVPGLGKTLLARALTRSIDADFKRVQCTPDLLPSDVTGVSVFNQQSGSFEFMKGPVFTNILLADEINRTTPRTQSSLLECMAERQVSVDGTTYPMANPFMVIATQNPVEFHGTYPLPEAQLDRFFMRVSMGYPSEADEFQVMSMHRGDNPVDALQPVMSLESVRMLQEAVHRIQVEESVARYIVSVVRQTREHPQVEVGSSPRGTIALRMAAQAVAMLTGKNYVTPQTIKQVAGPVLAHRIIVRQSAGLGGVAAETIIKEVLDTVTVPVSEGAA